MQYNFCIFVQIIINLIKEKGDAAGTFLPTASPLKIWIRNHSPFLLLSMCSSSDSFTVHTLSFRGISFWLITSIIPSA